MDDSNAASPASSSSSASDSDGFNTESARLYFGPLKTPERKFVASNQRLFPPVEASPLRRSPRLSSPRPQPQPAAQFDQDSPAEESEDIELVAQLVNEVEMDDDEEEEEEDELTNSLSGTPHKGNTLPDEPSSALADRVLHAADNPSPPPSPPAALTFFDPYHTTTPEISTDYQTDLLSLGVNGGTEVDEDNPLLVASTSRGSSSLLPVLNADSNKGDSTGYQDLISFDSFSTSPKPLKVDNVLSSDIPPSVPQEVLSVDDMLSRSPLGRNSPPKIPIVVIQVAGEEEPSNEDRMSVDPQALPEKPLSPRLATPDILEEDMRQPDTQTSSPAATLGEALGTPLRRSTRPRRSVTPNRHPLAPAPVFTAPPPSPARTLIKKKNVYRIQEEEEIVSDSQDEGEDVQRPPLRVADTISRVRQRSPGKEPIPFHREVGSLSPTSSNVLSSLAFTSTEDSNVVAGSSTRPSPQPPAMFSFSVFAPESDTAAPIPSTPVRSNGAVRFATPSKAQTSPNKFRIQASAPDDAVRTPARRIPIEEAIIQGHVSPEKAVQMGFKPNGTPQPPVASTPARRVLVSDKPTVAKSSGMRFGSPVKAVPIQRERSAEPGYRVLSSLKGKEKATPTSLRASSSSKPLPFPIVAAVPTSTVGGSSVSVAQTMAQDNLAKSLSSPAKSNLKQVTSRIPRIGSKPYSRIPDVKAPEKKAPTSIRAVDLSKSTSKPPAGAASNSTAKKSVGISESARPTASSSSRVRPAVSTATTVLKRKRDTEKSSPVKPRVIMLRQVPPAPLPEPSTTSQNPPAPIPAPTAAAKGKRPAPKTMRRVVSPDPPPVAPVVKQPSPPQASQPLPLPDESTIVYKPRKAKELEPEPMSSTPPFEPLQIPELDDLPPGSPMKQDVSSGSHLEPSESGKTGPETLPAPTIIVTEAPPVSVIEDEIFSGLRRTTRSRRGLTQEPVIEGTSRTKVSRRKAAASQSDDIFSGMSMTALKDLTTSNTLHNQKYLAAKLETEVIRRDGLRPESPAVKIRTIVQRQQEEQDKEREARAKRRARRSDEMATSDMEASSDVGYSSAAEQDQGSDEDMEDLPKHTRGAGDEDDYVTPERSMKGMRTRLFGDAAGVERVDQPASRRVKWDRGLFTTVYLDEVQLGSRQYSKENRSLKGCLAPTAKALRLDTLGNLPHTESPLGDLVPENVTVKKFVYDNDVAAPEIVVVKTRSKKRK